MTNSTVYVIHTSGRFWRRRHGHARSSWIAGLARASLYHRLSDAKRAAARIEIESHLEIWEVEMQRSEVAFAMTTHSAQNR